MLHVSAEVIMSYDPPPPKHTHTAPLLLINIVFLQQGEGGMCVPEKTTKKTTLFLFGFAL